MAKAAEFIKDINGDIFSEMFSLMRTVEFQRGLPHIHILLIIKKFGRLRTPVYIDIFISDELSMNEYDVYDSISSIS